jgi:hypothetical protein
VAVTPLAGLLRLFSLLHLVERGAEWPIDALENIVRAAEDSDDDRDWERRSE